MASFPLIFFGKRWSRAAQLAISKPARTINLSYSKVGRAAARQTANMRSSLPQYRLPNLRHLRVALEVSRSGSVTQAAKRVHLSQPAVTQAIGKLERELQVALFDRGHACLVPTETGRAFLARIERAFEHLANGARQALRVGGNGREHGFKNFDVLMTAPQLRALVALSDHRNFSIAAREIGLTQPTLHRAARNLESLAGLELFRTTPIGIELAPAAHLLIPSAKLAYAEIRQGLDEIKETLGRGRSRYVLGALPLARTMILPKAVNAMIRLSPKGQIQVIDGRYEELLRSLREGDIDCLIGALRHPPPADDVIQEPLVTDRLAIVTRPGHPLAGKNTVSLEDTLAFPWVAPPKNTPTGIYLSQTLRIAEMRQTPVRVVSSSLVFLRRLLQDGDYVTIISRHQIHDEIRQGMLSALPIKLKNSERMIGLTYRTNWRPTAGQERLLECLREASRGLPELEPVSIDRINGRESL